jgi:hypothetical protein
MEEGSGKNELPQRSDRVIALLAALHEDRSALLKLGAAVSAAPGAPMHVMDFLAFAAVKRSNSTALAFRQMIQTWNMVCARSLLRIHIDTALRFSAAWLVEKPHEFATEVLGGARIDKLKDNNGERLTDAYLVKLRASDHPWLPAVYENLCGYVHFSAKHIFATVQSVDAVDHSVSLAITDSDFDFPESSWIEILECFRETTGILGEYLHGYASTKRLSPEQLEAARRLWRDQVPPKSLS